MGTTHIKSPVAQEVIKKLQSGDRILISGVIYVARDAAHKRMVEALEQREKLPFDIKGQTVFYMGPSPARPGRVIGAAGPTTSSRMDTFTPRLIAAGLRVMIGKGERTKEVKDAIKEYSAIYLVAVGGAGALLGKTVGKSELVAYPDLGAEAILRLKVQDFPAIVAYDTSGGDLFEAEKSKYRRLRA
ncbi:MAG: Fe-S-containing hydro-lyase [Chloroflexota bacterium]